MKHTTATLLASLFLSTFAFAQEQLGLRLETYAGVSSLALNPTGNLNNPLKWDVNLAGASVFFENNYAFLRETSLRRLLQHRDDAEFVVAEDVEGPVADNVFVADFFNNGAARFVQTTATIMGPSLALRIGENHSAGVFTNMRYAFGTVKLPNELSYYQYDARPLQETFKMPEMRAALLGWSEIGLNYAFKVPTSDGSMNFGMSLKFLQGYDAAFVESQTTYLHTKLQGNAIALARPQGNFGYAVGSEDASNHFAEKNGRGLGLDLGFSYIFQDHEEGYRLKLAASLLDLGYLQFNKNAQAHSIRLDTVTTLQLDDYENLDPWADRETLLRTFSQNTLGDSLASYDGDNFRMALPAALSLQADFGVTENFYVNALLMQRLPNLNHAPRRGNLLAVTPRWQHRWFSASVPVSVYNLSRVHVGLAARLGWLVIGSDDLGGLFANKNFTGADFYFALKVNPFEIGGGRERGGTGKRRYGGRGKVKCYTF